jgi:hypothetical protein
MHLGTTTIHSISASGKLMPWKDNQPVGVILENIQFICLYSTKEKLDSDMKEMGVSNYSIKQIYDGVEFMESVRGYRVMLDPYKTLDDNNRQVTRFLELKENHGLN